MPQLEAAGETIHYLKAGKGEKTIVLLHGFGSDARSWTMNQPALAATATVYALDLPGHGASPARNFGDLDRLVDVVGAAIAALTPEAVHLVGHSMGGAIALRTAKMFPRALRALTLIAPAGIGATPTANFLEAFLAIDDVPSAQAALQMLVAKPAAINRPIVEGVLAARNQPHIYEAWQNMLPVARSVWSDTSAWRAALAALPMPIQILWGEKDIVLPPPQTDALPAKVTLHRLPDPGHVPHMEAMKEVNRLIAAFDAAA